jgi:hypothetical protein
LIILPRLICTVSAPKFVPVATVDAFRGDTALPPAQEWKSDRPAELPDGSPTTARMGRPGPDQGYAIKLANTFHGKLHLTEGEDEHDAIAGCLGVALKRASMFSRAPVIHDLRVAFNAFGYLGTAPAELVELRKKRFEAVGHHYELQREIADLVPEETLRMTPEAVARRVEGGNWKSLLAL